MNSIFLFFFVGGLSSIGKCSPGSGESFSKILSSKFLQKPKNIKDFHFLTENPTSGKTLPLRSPDWVALVRFWCALGLVLGVLRRSWAPFGWSWVAPGRSCGTLGWSEGALGTLLGGMGGDVEAVLGRS